MKELHLKIDGMSCASCASTIEREVGALDGVTLCSVNFATSGALIEVTNADIQTVIEEKIRELDFFVVEDGSDTKKSENTLMKFSISITFSIFLFLFAMGPLMHWPSHQANHYIQFFLALPVWIWIGLRFQKSVLTFFRTGRSNMNTLIGIGTSAAFLYSTFITFFSELSINLGLTQNVYFEAVGFIISFVYLGNYFEERAKRKTKEALDSLLKLSVKDALVKRGDEFVEVGISKVVIGDIIRVKPGGKFPVDGKIIEGSSAVDESMLSGEPIPVTKSTGDKVFSGTINGDSVIDFKAQKVGSDTFLAQIVHFVEAAQNNKPQIQRYADKVSSVFTPIVITMAVITFCLWFFLGSEPIWGNSISNFIAVLVIACPCALGLATPTAVVVATGKASLKGLLIGGGEVIEKANGIDAIVFDKTGTLTLGRPEVVEFKTFGDEDSQVILKDVASIEAFSEHPLSKAVINYAAKSDLKLSEPDFFEVHKGKGIEADIAGSAYIIGSQKLLEEFEIDLSEDAPSEKVGSFIYVAKDKKFVSKFVVGDKIKPNAKEMIAKLKARGIETWLITGDNEIVGNAVASELAIDQVVSNCLPLDKASHIEEIKKSGKKVAMVGDGINDAPALAIADLSLAMGTGTDVAISASDVTIVKGDIEKVVSFIDLSYGTMKIIKQNLFLSMIYNSLLIPIAAGALVLIDGPLMPPILASVAMGLSSISVVSNSLRIRNLI
ncbi:copper-translocating P-type ATPase [Halobacteriovorax marinus]|uniref:Copper-translocating P-type ATPase n=1 Tax=Halobacteriovorax marinus TaxID=97084 RepID=A0A1Y5FG49_9BACT|nr:copper-translocating P-type ATPase [Halobacteriovorax marinus]